jgi:hypothetical protein
MDGFGDREYLSSEDKSVLMPFNDVRGMFKAPEN